MIRNDQLSWFKEYLMRLTVDNPADRSEVADIVATFAKLWHVAKAAELNPHPRSARLEEALVAIKPAPRVEI